MEKDIINPNKNNQTNNNENSNNELKLLEEEIHEAFDKPCSIKSSNSRDDNFLCRFKTYNKKSIIKNNNNDDCMICYSEINDFVYIEGCNHYMCKKCLGAHSLTKDDCPLCRREIVSVYYYRNGNINNKVIESLSTFKEMAKQMKAEREKNKIPNPFE